MTSFHRSVAFLAFTAAACSKPGPTADPTDSRTESPPGSTSDTVLPTEPGARVTDAFVVTLSGVVDVLWVIDNSSSMTDQQSELAAASGQFLGSLLGTGLDYHVGVTSADLTTTFNGAQGRLVEVAGANLVDGATTDPLEVFQDMVVFAEVGSTFTAGLGAAYVALEQEADAANAGFLRDGSTVHVLMVGDGGEDSGAVITPPAFIDWLDGLRPDPADTSFSALCDPGVGDPYFSVAAAVGGLQMDLHGDWSANVDAFTDLVLGAGAPTTVFALSRLPDVPTLSVTVEAEDGSEQEIGSWTYDAVENTVTLVGDAPAARSLVIVEYVPLD